MDKQENCLSACSAEDTRMKSDSNKRKDKIIKKLLHSLTTQVKHCMLLTLIMHILIS